MAKTGKNHPFRSASDWLPALCAVADDAVVRAGFCTVLASGASFSFAPASLRASDGEAARWPAGALAGVATPGAPAAGPLDKAAARAAGIVPCVVALGTEEPTELIVADLEIELARGDGAWTAYGPTDLLILDAVEAGGVPPMVSVSMTMLGFSPPRIAETSGRRAEDEEEARGVEPLLAEGMNAESKTDEPTSSPASEFCSNTRSSTENPRTRRSVETVR
ncbi:MAG: hypothetical protein BJ554DRAFT_3714 [Olpidium bornovanus]|uniref:Uncharacterized protein n=1 Tax=Olpidium bornovanus TaxID=278681 RepID=A0A8H7ZNX0_9FUNG|nr:MAG: hypothetical protein BJ554DRAFT_3714 [Olpidium bornovanus]